MNAAIGIELLTTCFPGMNLPIYYNLKPDFQALLGALVIGSAGVGGGQGSR